MSADLAGLARERSERGEPYALATVVWRRGPSSGRQGSKALIDPDGTLHGWIGGACAEPAVIRESLLALSDGRPRLMFLGPPEELAGHHGEGVVTVPIACQSEGAIEVYVEPVLPSPRVVAVGRSPAVETLVSMARALGWDATAFADANELVAGSAGKGAIVVVATQGHDDEAALEAALRLEPAYVGLVASRRRAESVLDYLRARGVPEQQVAQVRAPAGLDLGSIEHEEIAVAILAELVQLRGAGTLSRATAEIVIAEEAVDPICGMTVRVEGSVHTVERDGTVWHFCSAGCRQRFVAQEVEA